MQDFKKEKLHHLCFLQKPSLGQRGTWQPVAANAEHSIKPQRHHSYPKAHTRCQGPPDEDERVLCEFSRHMSCTHTACTLAAYANPLSLAHSYPAEVSILIQNPKEPSPTPEHSHSYIKWQNQNPICPFKLNKTQRSNFPRKQLHKFWKKTWFSQSR